MNSDSIKTTDLRMIFTIIRKRKWLIILPFIIVTGIVVGVSYTLTPVYESSTIIAIDAQVKLSSDLQRLLGIRSTYHYPEDRMEQLRSYYNEITSSLYLQQLVEKLKLDQNPAVTAAAQEAALTRPNMTMEQVRFDMIQNHLRSQIDVSYAANDQIRIAVTSTDPGNARDIANTLGEIFIDEKLKQELSSIRSSQDFSDIQLQKYENLLNEKIKEKTDFEKDFIKIQLDESITSDTNRQEIVTEIDRTNNDITDYQGDEREILSRLANTTTLSTNNLKLSDSDKKERTRNELKQRLRSIGDLMIKYTWNDPQILNFKVKQNNLLNEIETENRKLVNEQYTNVDDSARMLLVQLFNIRSNLDYMYSKASYLKAALDELVDKMNLIPEYQAKLDRLDREIEAARGLRDQFKNQQESSSISQALVQDLSSSRYRIIEPAKFPLGPISPNKMQIMLIGIMLGLVIGGVAAVLAELFDSSYRKVEDVEKELELPVMGVMPKIEFLKQINK